MSDCHRSSVIDRILRPEILRCWNSCCCCFKIDHNFYVASDKPIWAFHIAYKNHSCTDLQPKMQHRKYFQIVHATCMIQSSSLPVSRHPSLAHTFALPTIQHEAGLGVNTVWVIGAQIGLFTPVAFGVIVAITLWVRTCSHSRWRHVQYHLAGSVVWAERGVVVTDILELTFGAEMTGTASGNRTKVSKR